MAASSALALCLVTNTALAAAPSSVSSSRPRDIVALSDIAGSISQEIRYAGPANFTGAPLPGYAAPKCLLTQRAATALAAVEASLAAFGLGLKVYDCYRPTTAVAAMLRWADRTDPLSTTERWFLPALERADAFARGYLARHSGHSRASTVDVTLVARGSAARSLAQLPTHGPSCLAPHDEDLSLGTAHDCFAEQAHTHAPGLPSAVRAARALLVQEMRAQGFVNYHREWWHFTLRQEPYPQTAFSFEVR